MGASPPPAAIEEPLRLKWGFAESSPDITPHQDRGVEDTARRDGKFDSRRPRLKQPDRNGEEFEFEYRARNDEEFEFQYSEGELSEGGDSE